MQDLTSLNLLIDAASSIAGSDTRLAELLDMPKQHLSHWRHGRKTCTPEDRALLAAIAGKDPVCELTRATIEKWRGKPKGELLKHVLG